jgi:hypothetical protein
VSDAAGNAGTGSTNSNNYAIDNVRPAASIVVADNSLTVGETSVVTITFSEAVTGFTNGDLTIANGTLSAVSSGDGGITWTATLTPTASIIDTTNVITLNNTGVQDAAGNAGIGTINSNNYAIDTAPLPTLAIAATDANQPEGNTGNTPFTFTVTRTGDLSGASSAAYAVTGGTATAADFSGGTLPTGTVSFAADAATAIITVNVAGDTTVEPDEGFTVTLSGASGATITTATATGTILNDDTAPAAVATVTALSADTGIAGDFITSTAAQTVSGTFTGTLGNGETIQVSADGGTTWLTATTPAAGTWSASGVTLTAGGTALSVRTIDTAGNITARTSHSYTLDTTAPAVSSVAATAASTDIGAGEVVTLTVNFSEAVTVAGGTPTLSLDDGGTATYVSGSGDTALRFNYTVSAGQNSPAPTVMAAALNGATILDGAGNPASLSGVAITPSGAPQIDTIAPTVSSVAASPSDAILGAGAGAILTLGLSEPVTVNTVGGNPTLTLNNGGTATYVSGSGSDTLAFDYTVAAGQAVSDLAVTAANLNGGTIIDDAGNVANLTGAAVNPTGTLSIQPSGIAAFDTSSDQSVGVIAEAYIGPVAGIQNEYINLSHANLNITATAPNYFLHSGSGDDALAVSSGTNVLDGGGGSNFLSGGTGSDTFFVDARGATADIWSTVVGFHAGDAITMWGVSPADFTFVFQDNQGAPGYTGLTLHAIAPGEPIISMTIAGFTKADLSSGRISEVSGTDPVSGSTYTYFHENT